MESGAQFTSAATAAAATVCLGFTPDFVIMVQDTAGTNPNLYLWVDKTKFGVADADTDNDDVFLLTGSSGVVTKTEGIKPHVGNTAVTTSNDQDIYLANGVNMVAGDRTTPGLEIAAAIQTNAGHNLIFCGQSNGLIKPVV